MSVFPKKVTFIVSPVSTAVLKTLSLVTGILTFFGENGTIIPQFSYKIILEHLEKKTQILKGKKS